MRPMFFQFPEDPRCWELEEQYMFGDRYLVAPVLYEGQRSREVYLPAGSWKGFFDQKVYHGPAAITADAPLPVIPVFEKWTNKESTSYEHHHESFPRRSKPRADHEL